MINAINLLRSLFGRHDKIHFFTLLAYTLFYSLMETVAIGIIFPFINLLTDFQYVQSFAPLRYVYTLAGEPSQVITMTGLGIALVLFYFGRSLITLHYAYSTSKFTQGRYHYLAYRLFNHYLTLRYTTYQAMHSSQLTRTIVTEASNLSVMLQQSLIILAECFVIFFIYLFLFFMNWQITLVLTLYIGLMGGLVMRISSKKSKVAGLKRAFYHSKFYRTITDTFTNFKIIKLIADHQFLQTHFQKHSFKLSKTNVTHAVLGQLPRAVLEGSGLIMMVIIVIYATYQHIHIMLIAPFLAAYGLAFFRILPAVNRILGAYHSLLFTKPSLRTVHHHLNLDTEGLGQSPLLFKKQIQINQVSFAYPNKSDHQVINNLTLTIPYGHKMGIMGPSGAGKSTFLDLLSGLILPDSGEILIDDVCLDPDHLLSWRDQIGYVTQETTLFDDTVAYNVAFGHPLDLDRVKTVLTAVKLYDFFEGHQGLDTLLGENGCRLSGGQRQRIGVARALYHDPKLIILDEATSALDKETEQHLIHDVFSKLEHRTVVSVSHHEAALVYCDEVVRLGVCQK